MRKVYYFLLLLIFPSIVWGQIIWLDHFSYMDTLPDGTYWTKHSGADTVPVLPGSLSYPGYMAGEGNKVELKYNRYADVGRNLDQTYSDGAIYCSFLIKVTDTSNDTTYFFHFFQGTSGTIFGGSVWIRRAGFGFQLGINARTSKANTQWASDILNLNTAYLIVVKYQFVSGDSNDVASLWINPNLSGPEPTPNVSHTNAGRDLSSIGRVALRQASGIGTIEIDEMRVGRSWGDAPLPVQISNIIAEALTHYVKIKIETQTEPEDFLGFNIYRGRDGENFNLIASHESVNELKAKGSGAFGEKYEFVDKDITTAGEYYYKVEAVSLSERKFVSDVLRVIVELPKNYVLHQNYPNPFNPVTTIEFELPERVWVELIVYDVAGREVRRLVDEILDAGHHSVKFDASGLPSGVYFYILRAGGFVEVKKMILAK